MTGPARAEDIAVDEADPPFMYERDGVAAGFYPALVIAAFKRMGEPVTVRAMPWKRALADLEAGVIGAAGIYENPDRRGKLDFSARIYSETTQVYVAEDKVFPFKSVDDLSGRSIGVIRGWSYDADFSAARAAGRLSVVEVTGDAQNFALLLTNRVDAILAVQESAGIVLASLSETERRHVVALPTPLSSNTSFLAFGKSAGKIALLARFDRALAEMRGDGSFDRILHTAVKEAE